MGCLGLWLLGLPQVGIEGDTEQGIKADAEALAAFSCIGIESSGKSEIVGHGAIMAPFWPHWSLEPVWVVDTETSPASGTLPTAARPGRSVVYNSANFSNFCRW